MAAGVPAAAQERRAFRFVQFEFPWALGPADGRYVVREAAGAPPSHVLVLATLGATERRRLRARRPRGVAPEPPPSPVATARATIVDAQAVPLAEAEQWLAAADAGDAERALALVARAVRAHRLASADPAVHEPALAQALVVRVGHGAGEQVAAGRWSAAHELAPPRAPRRQRTSGLQPQERLAELLGGRSRALACEELTLRARHDLDHGQLREAALQLRAALDAALSELPSMAGPVAPGASGGPPAAGAPIDMATRVAELRARRDALTALVDAALAGTLPPDAAEMLGETLKRLEAAVRAGIARRL